MYKRQVYAYHPELRLQRREGVIGNLGTRRRYSTQEGALAGIGQSQQADVGEQA